METTLEELQEAQKLDKIANIIIDDMNDEETLKFQRLATFTSLTARELYLTKCFYDLSGNYVELEKRLRDLEDNGI